MISDQRRCQGEFLSILTSNSTEFLHICFFHHRTSTSTVLHTVQSNHPSFRRRRGFRNTGALPARQISHSSFAVPHSTLFRNKAILRFELLVYLPTSIRAGATPVSMLTTWGPMNTELSLPYSRETQLYCGVICPNLFRYHQSSGFTHSSHNEPQLTLP